MKHSKLHSVHKALGGRFVDFSGWELPFSYGTKEIAEHFACRNKAAVFDISHLGRLYFKNSGEHLQWRLTNDLEKLGLMQAQYTHLLDEQTGFVLDDLICVRMAHDEHLVITNASNHDVVARELEHEQNENSLSECVFLAVQGPQTNECLRDILGQGIIEKNQASWISYKGSEILMLGTGYTGEVGVECIIPESVAEDFLMDLVNSGVVPAGLGARDILRLEAGYPLHGHELGEGITPLQAQLEWVIAWDKGDFSGREALIREKETGVKKLLWGFKIENERRPLREGNPIYYDGRKVGEITSGNFSPSLKCAIGMGFLEAQIGLDFEGVEVGDRKAKVCRARLLLELL